MVICAPLSAQEVDPPAEPVDVAAYLPTPDTVKAHDRPSDDGTAIIVTWPIPDETPEDLTYVIQVAPASEGFPDEDPVVRDEEDTDENGDTVTVTPSSETRCDENPKYFGFSEDNEGLCFAEVVLAEIFKAPTPAQLIAEHAAKTHDAETVARIKAALESKTPLGELTDGQRDDHDLAIDASMAWRVSTGMLSDDQAQRAARASRLLADFEREVFLETEQAKGDEKLVEETEKQVLAMAQEAVVALEAAKVAPAISDEELTELAKTVEVSRDAVRLAKADTLAASRRVKWMPEAVRNRYSPTDQREMDWLKHLTAYLDRQDKKAAKKADDATNAQAYVVRIGVQDGESVVFGACRDLALKATARPNLFKWYRLNNLIFALTFSTIVLVFIQVARRNPNLFVRKIAGLDAIEEAIGRCTEMGRSAYFIHGYGGTGSMPTIAALNILSRVARRAADYDTRVKVTNLDPIVTAVSQEVVQQAYMEAGRPDAFDTDDVFYLTTCSSPMRPPSQVDWCGRNRRPSS